MDVCATGCNRSNKEGSTSSSLLSVGTSDSLNIIILPFDDGSPLTFLSLVSGQLHLDVGNSGSGVEALWTRFRAVEDGVAPVQAHLVLEAFLPLRAVGILQSFRHTIKRRRLPKLTRESAIHL